MQCRSPASRVINSRSKTKRGKIESIPLFSSHKLESCSIEMSGSSEPIASDSVPNDGKYHFAIDRGGTFTDVVATLPSGDIVVSKLLSEDPQHYSDAPTEGIRRVMESHDVRSGIDYCRGKVVCTSKIGSIRMGSKLLCQVLVSVRNIIPI